MSRQASSRCAARARARAEQARAAGRLDALQRALEGKEAEMARLAGGEGRVTALKAHFDAALAQLAEERNALQRERGQLVQARPLLAGKRLQGPRSPAKECSALQHERGSWCSRSFRPAPILWPTLDALRCSARPHAAICGGWPTTCRAHAHANLAVVTPCGGSCMLIP